MQNKRMVITGLGVISPSGIGKSEFFSNILSGKSGIKPITLFQVAGLRSSLAGEIYDFDAKEILGDVGLVDLDRANLFLSSAGKLALDDAKLTINGYNTNRIGVSVGSAFGNLHSISRFDRESLVEGAQYVNPSIFPNTVGNSVASRLNIRFGIKGFSSSLSTGISSALDALNYGCDFVKLDKADIVLVGGVESLSEELFLGFNKLNYLASNGLNSKEMTCPFDKRRNGIILSEGAAVLVLENLSSAKERKADIYAEIIEIGSCFGRGEGIAEAMQLALTNSGFNPNKIDCIFANANSTKNADIAETLAIKKVFGEAAYKIPITAIKSMLGESLGASGAFSLSAAIGALRNDLIPPTINYQEKDETCDLDYCLNEARNKKLSNIMVNSFDPRGTSTSVIIRKFVN
ncbi:MAG: beta-ketoacyl-[acyl-carrier-protein] synthase family protein [Candidatus Omnitrophica bacterium]|nr:beta-ketoacyl-[acyl-carrier-protein] synthase family protein [Candidatus Omnitrophota bacterium]